MLGISARELEIVEALIAGFSAREIALDLSISFHTVRTHIRNIYLKTGAANRIELLRWRESASSRN
jgi:DNA-binding NarL/FixJ family response regulator